MSTSKYRLWSLLSATAIGLSYFVIGATNRNDTQYWEHLYDISIIWLSTGVVGLLAFILLWSSIGHLTVAGHLLDVEFPPVDAVTPNNGVEGRHDESDAHLDGAGPSVHPGRFSMFHASTMQAPQEAGIPSELDAYPIEAAPEQGSKHDTPESQNSHEVEYSRFRAFWFSPRLRWLRKASMYALTAFGGVLISLSQACLKIGFRADYIDWGPITSVTCSDVIIVTLFFHFVLGLRVSKVEVASMCIVALGLAITLFVDVKEALPVSAVGFAFAASCCLSASVILIRHSVTAGVSPLTGFVVRMVTQGALGLILLAKVLLSYPVVFSQKTRYDMILPAFAGVAQATAVLAVNKAMAGPPMDFPPAILSLSPIVVLILAYVFYGVLPRPGLAVGMFVTLLGCVIPLILRLADVREDTSTDLRAPLIENNSTPPLMPPPPPYLRDGKTSNTVVTPDAATPSFSPPQSYPRENTLGWDSNSSFREDTDGACDVSASRMVLAREVSGLDIFKVI